jgi:glycosyltransferase domain-containing protein
MSVSIIILSNLDDRRDWLVHRLLYLDQTGFDGEVVVGVWGGHDQIPFVQKKCQDLIQRCRISIFPQDGSLLAPRRIVDLAGKCQEDFVVMQGDDDFIVPSALVKPVERLRRDPTVIGAQGRCITLMLHDGITPNMQFLQFPVWEALEDDVVERYCALMKHYSFTWHAVYRRPQFIERMRYMIDMLDNANDFIFFESIGDLYSVIKGKLVVFNELFLIRGEHQQNGSKTLRAGINFEMPPYLLLSPHFSQTYKYFEGKCIELFQSMGVNTSEEATMRRILDGMMDFMGRLFYKRRDRMDPAELTFQAECKDLTNPELISTFQQIYASHKVAERANAEMGSAAQ